MLLQRNISHAFDMTSNKKKSLKSHCVLSYFPPSFSSWENHVICYFLRCCSFHQNCIKWVVQEMNCCNVAANAKRDQSSKNLERMKEGKLHFFLRKKKWKKNPTKIQIKKTFNHPISKVHSSINKSDIWSKESKGIT